MNKNCKLTPEQVLEIREAKELVKRAKQELERLEQRKKMIKHEMKKLTNHAISKQLGCHQRTVDKITNYETWAHV